MELSGHTVLDFYLRHGQLRHFPPSQRQMEDFTTIATVHKCATHFDVWHRAHRISILALDQWQLHWFQSQRLPREFRLHWDAMHRYGLTRNSDRALNEDMLNQCLYEPSRKASTWIIERGQPRAISHPEHWVCGRTQWVDHLPEVCLAQSWETNPLEGQKAQQDYQAIASCRACVHYPSVPHRHHPTVHLHHECRRLTERLQCLSLRLDQNTARQHRYLDSHNLPPYRRPDLAHCQDMPVVRPLTKEGNLLSISRAVLFLVWLPCQSGLRYWLFDEDEV